MKREPLVIYQRLLISQCVSGCWIREMIAPQLSQASGATPVCTAPHVSHTQRCAARRVGRTASKRIASCTAVSLLVLIIVLCAIIGYLLRFLYIHMKCLPPRF